MHWLLSNRLEIDRVVCIQLNDLDHSVSISFKQNTREIKELNDELDRLGRK